jgi:hypothetical protein
MDQLVRAQQTTLPLCIPATQPAQQTPDRESGSVNIQTAQYVVSMLSKILKEMNVDHALPIR